MAIAMLIGLWVGDELNYDRQNPHYDRIARVMQNQTTNGVAASSASMPFPLLGELRSAYGRHVNRVVGMWWTQEHVLAFGDKRLTQQGRFAEPGAAEMMGLSFLTGDGGLEEPGSVLLSASAAKAMFGDVDAVGKTVTIDSKMVVRVKGIYADIPHHSAFANLQFIAPLELFVRANPWAKTALSDWGYDLLEIYVQLKDGVDVSRLSAGLRNVTLDKMKDNPLGAAYHPQVFLHPMKRWHLYGDFRNGVNVGGKIQFVWLFGTIGFFVLLLACINFMNLATARSERRAREVGVRKTMGSLRGQLVVQFYCESIVVAMAAFVVAVGLVIAALPFFNILADKQIVIGWSSIFAGLGFALFTGLLAGSYPAFYLSSFRPVGVLKGVFKAGPRAGGPRRVLVVLQFTVSVLLIIGTIVVYRQIKFAKDRSVGYNPGGLLSVSIHSTGFEKHAETVRQELLRTGVVADAAIASSSATVIWDFWTGYQWRGKDPAVQGDFTAIDVSPTYGRTLGWQFVAGRDFSPDLATDSSAAVINEAAVAFMGFKQPIGERISDANGKVWTVIGVIRNVVVSSPYDRVMQAIYTIGDDYQRTFVFVRVRPGMSMPLVLPAIRTAFQRVMPAESFDYRWVDDEYAKKFEAEVRIGKIAGFFALFALFISGLGIFGMASFMAEQRRKEIGVRRVLGGSVVQIWALLSREFLGLVGLSFLIGGPLGYFAMHRWLEGYVYHAGIPWWVFVVTGSGVMGITLVTVSWQGVRAALMNPVVALRSE
jgi:putative ABC transport system permease protein